MYLKKLIAWWQEYQAGHPFIAGAFVVVESAIAGVIVDLLTNGYDFSHGGWKHAVTLIGTTAVMALRNYLKTNSANLKVKLLKPPDAAK